MIALRIFVGVWDVHRHDGHGDAGAVQPHRPAPEERDEEYDEIHDRFVAEGVPLVDDREQAWRDFAGWRVNYDRPLLSLATFVESPPTPWSSDRQVDLPPPINLRRGRRWS